MSNPSFVANDAYAITPGSGDLPKPGCVVFCGGAGDLHVLTQGGTDVTVAMAAGAVFPCRVTRVYSDSTSTEMIGLLY